MTANGKLIWRLLRLVSGAVFFFALSVPGIGLAAGPISDRALAGRIIQDAGCKKGLCLVLGGRNSSLAMEILRQSEFKVQVVESDAREVEDAREAIAAKGLYGGRLFVIQAALSRLPYPDNFVNLIVVNEGKLDGLSAKEVKRVLRPESVAWIRRGPLGKAFGADKEVELRKKQAAFLAKKLRPAGMEDWSHRMHDASGNPVSEDRFAGPPFRTQWIAGPVTNMSGHYGGNSVSADGRLFYFDFNKSIRNKAGDISQQVIYARDAFNGLLLWKRLTPVPKRASPNELVAVGDLLFNIGTGKGCQVIDAQTGTTRKTLLPDVAWKRIVRYRNLLYGIAGGSLCAFDVESGRKVWSYESKGGFGKYGSICAGDGRLFVMDGGIGIVGLDAKTGKVLWESTDKDSRGTLTSFVYHAGRLFFVNRYNMKFSNAISADDGSLLWKIQRPFSGRGGFLLADDFILGSFSPRFGGYAGLILHDQATGGIRRKISGLGGAGRCTMMTGLRDWVFASGGIHAFSLKTKETYKYNALRSGCRQGFVHANGLTYGFPNDCFCGHSIKGITSMAHAGGWRPGGPGEPPEKRFVRGPAYGTGPGPQSRALRPDADWPSFKHDIRNSGTTPGPVPVPEGQSLWESDTDGIPTPPVAGGGLVLVGTSTHRVRCFDAPTGRLRWTHAVGGAVRFSPALYQDLVLFGSDDGRVTCLKARSGRLVWRLQAAPEERWITYYDELVSTWMISAGVLVDKDVAYFCAGRAAWDGVYLYAVEPRSGKIIWRNGSLGLLRRETKAKDPNSPEAVARWSEGRRKKFEKWKGKGEKMHIPSGVQMPGVSPYGAMVATETHLVVPMGYGRPFCVSRDKGELNMAFGGSHEGGNRLTLGEGSWYFAGSEPATGRIRDKWSRSGGYNIYGVASGTTGFRRSGKPARYSVKTGFKLQEPTPAPVGHAMHFFPLAFCGPLAYAKKELYSSVWRDNGSDLTGASLESTGREGWVFNHHWLTRVPIIARTVVVTKDAIFYAGEKCDEKGDLLGKGALYAFGRTGGKKLGEWALPGSPVTDGMAAAGGRIFISTRDGKLLCFGRE